MPVRSLKDGTIKVIVDDDGTATPASVTVTVDVEEGDLSYTEQNPANIISDRGVLDHARMANEEPIDLSWSVRFQTFLTEDTPTLYEILTQTGDASGYVSQEPNSDIYAVKVAFDIVDPSGTAATETLTFDRFVPETVEFSEGDPHNTLSADGRAPIASPTIT